MFVYKRISSPGAAITATLLSISVEGGGGGGGGNFGITSVFIPHFNSLCFNYLYDIVAVGFLLHDVETVGMRLHPAPTPASAP
jgi:hypothetical protein